MARGSAVLRRRGLSAPASSSSRSRSSGTSFAGGRSARAGKRPGDRLGHRGCVAVRVAPRRPPARGPIGSGGRRPSPRSPSGLRRGPRPSGGRRRGRAARRPSRGRARPPPSRRARCPRSCRACGPIATTGSRNGSRNARFAHSADHQSTFRPISSDPIAAHGLAIAGLDRRHPAEHRRVRSTGPGERRRVAEHQRPSAGRRRALGRRRLDLEPQARSQVRFGLATRAAPDPRGPAGIRSEPRMALLDRRVVLARRSDAGGRDPPGGGRPDRLVAAERVAHDRARPRPRGSAAAASAASRPSGASRRIAATRSSVDAGWRGREPLDEHGRIDPAAGDGSARRRSRIEPPPRPLRRPRARGRTGTLRRRGRPTSGSRLARRARRSPRQAGRAATSALRVEAGERRGSPAGRGSSERASRAARSGARTPSGRSPANRPTPSRTRSTSSAGSPVSSTETATSTSASSDVERLDRPGGVDRRRAAGGDGRQRLDRRATARAERGVAVAAQPRQPAPAAADRCDAATSGRRLGDRRARPSSSGSPTSCPIRAIAARWTSGDAIGQRVGGDDGGPPSVAPANRHRPGRRGPGRPSPSRPAPRRGPGRSGRAASSGGSRPARSILTSAATAIETVGPTRLRRSPR